MRPRVLKLLALGFAAIVVVAVLAPAVPAADKPPIKIGLITPKTGNFAQMGIDMAEGFKLYLSEINYQVAGRKIELVEEDEGAQPAQAVDKVRKLVTHDKVNIVVGLFMAAAAYAAAPVAQEAEVPLVITIAASDDLTQRKASKYLARVSFTGGELGHAAGDYAYKKLGWRKVSAIAMDYGWGHETAGAFQRVFEEQGGQVIQKIWTPVNTTDFGPYVASLKPEADGILDVVTGAASIRLLGELRKTGVLDKKKVLAAGSATDETLLTALGDTALGVLSFYPWSAALVIARAGSIGSAHATRSGCRVIAPITSAAGKPIRVASKSVRCRELIAQRRENPTDDLTSVLVHAEVDDAVREPRVAGVLLDDQERGGLLAAPVSSRGLRRPQAGEEPLGERPPRARLERLGECVDGGGRDEDVSLGCVAVARTPSGPLVTALAGERRRTAFGVDYTDLALRAAWVRGRERLDHGWR